MAVNGQMRKNKQKGLVLLFVEQTITLVLF
jgi:hypothetical protein